MHLPDYPSDITWHETRTHNWLNYLPLSALVYLRTIVCTHNLCYLAKPLCWHQTISAIWPDTPVTANAVISIMQLLVPLNLTLWHCPTSPHSRGLFLFATPWWNASETDSFHLFKSKNISMHDVLLWTVQVWHNFLPPWLGPLFSGFPANLSSHTSDKPVTILLLPTTFFSKLKLYLFQKYWNTCYNSSKISSLLGTKL